MQTQRAFAAPVVVATVAGDPIYAGELRAARNRIPRYKTMSEADRNRLEAELLAQRIDQRIALRYLIRHKRTVSSHQIEAAMEKARSHATRQNVAWLDYLAKQGVTEDAFRTDLTWRLTWGKYLHDRITDDVLQQYFDRHRADFDGTKKRVRHILLKEDRPNDPSARAAIMARAAQIRKEIVDGTITFADATKKYSTSPSRAEGGDLGVISRHGEMVEPFAAAAFALKQNEISRPVVTPHGVHLIQCVETHAGDRTWKDVADALRREVLQRGFRKIVEQERPNAEVEFTGRAPYFRPGTRTVVIPEATK